jgi:hypothetical protein
MKRYGHEPKAIYRVKPSPGECSQKRTKRIGQIAFIRILELMNGLHEIARVKVRSPQCIIERPFTQAAFTDMIFFDT